MKKILWGMLAVTIVVIAVAIPVRSKMKSYYTGDAINFNGTVVVVSTNSDALEAFTLRGDNLEKFAAIKIYNGRFAKYDSFNDVKLNQENGRLYAYATSGYTIYKYDLSSLDRADLVISKTNTYWEWYNRVDKFGNDIVTISSRGVKVFDKNLETIDSYDIKNDYAYNIRGNDTAKYIFNVKKDGIEVFDRTTRQVTKKINISFFGGDSRMAYFDSYDNMIYTVDSRAISKYDLNGVFQGSFEHSGNPGYEIASTNNEYIYFSNGVGVVKLDKSNMNPVKWEYTGAIAGDNGWAMGLKVVPTSEGDRAIVFNNSSVLALSDNVKKITAVRYSQEDNTKEITENLFLKVDTLSAIKGSSVNLTGGGYFPNEKLTITLLNTKTEVFADQGGRFQIALNVPGVSEDVLRVASVNQKTTAPIDVKQRTDIKVEGQDSKLHYSTSLEIKN
jgi:hypothetical protein